MEAKSLNWNKTMNQPSYLMKVGLGVASSSRGSKSILKPT